MNICRKCVNAWIYGEKEGREVIRCRAVSPPLVVNGRVDHCSDFHHKAQPDKWELEKVAWPLKMNNSGTIKGFERPKPVDTE